jgi:hypothetical protein
MGPAGTPPPMASGRLRLHQEQGMAAQRADHAALLCGLHAAAGLAALAHDIRGLLALLGWREPPQALSSA